MTAVNEAKGSADWRVGSGRVSPISRARLICSDLAGSMLLYTITSTWVYFQQSDLAREALQRRERDRTIFLANLEIWVNSITVLIQIFLTGRLLKWFGVGFTLVAMPFLSMVGFAAMGIAPSLALLAVFQVMRRAAAYALLRPSREMLVHGPAA